MREGLPPSSLDRSAYPSGPNGMARMCEDRLAELVRQAAASVDAAELKAIKRQTKVVRDLLRFAKSRAGYIAAG